MHKQNIFFVTGPCSLKRELNTSANSTDPDQSVQSAQADLDQNLVLFVKFLYDQVGQAKK